MEVNFMNLTITWSYGMSISVQEFSKIYTFKHGKEYVIAYVHVR